MSLENHQSFDDIYDIKKMERSSQILTRDFMSQQCKDCASEFSAAKTPSPCRSTGTICIIVDECHRGYALDMEMSEKEMQFSQPSRLLESLSPSTRSFRCCSNWANGKPAQHTSQIFGPPIYEYSYRQAVIDDYLCDHEPPYRLITDLATNGITGKKVNKLTSSIPAISQSRNIKLPMKSRLRYRNSTNGRSPRISIGLFAEN